MFVIINIDMTFLGLVHFLVPIGNLLYMVFGPKWLDPYAFIALNVLVLHWIMFKGECIISYLYKKHVDPSYVMGDDVSLNDMVYIVQKFTPSLKDTSAHALLDVLNFGSFVVMLARFVLLETVLPTLMIYVFSGLSCLYIFTLRSKLLKPYQGLTNPTLFVSFMVIIVLTYMRNIHHQ